MPHSQMNPITNMHVGTCRTYIAIEQLQIICKVGSRIRVMFAYHFLKDPMVPNIVQQTSTQFESHSMSSSPEMQDTRGMQDEHERRNSVG